MREVKLGEVCKQAKRVFEIDDQTEYKRCRVQLHYRGVVIRDSINGYEIKTKKQQLCKSGDFIVAEMDAKFGGYGFIPENLDDAIVSSHYYLFTIDKSKLLPEYLWILAKMGVLQKQTRAQGSTNYSSVRPKAVLNFVIPLPELEVQKRIVALIHGYEALLEKTNDALQLQSDLIVKLRNLILSDAVSGCLVFQDPTDESASVLLERIRAGKERLIKDGKLKRDKPLSPITTDEIPYELPDGWVWCRLGTIASIKRGVNPKYSETDTTKILNQKCVRWFEIEVEHAKIVQQIWMDSLSSDSFAMTGDILVNSTGDGTIGRSAVIKNDDFRMPFDSHILKLTSQCNSRYISCFINSEYGQTQVQSLKGATTTKQTELGVGNLNIFVFPLPPLAEQERIVAKVEKLMDTCDALEAEVAKSRAETDRLMQTILKEAFENKKTGVTHE